MGAPAQGSAPLFASGTRQRPPSPACRRSPGRGTVPVHGQWTPGSRKATENLLRAKQKRCQHPALPTGQELLELRCFHPLGGAQTSLPHTWSPSSLSCKQMKKPPRRSRALVERHSPGAWPVDPWEQESNGESAPGQAKEVSASSTPHGAGAAGATLLSPTWWSADELAAYLESVFPKLQADEEATEEIKSFGGEAQSRCMASGPLGAGKQRRICSGPSKRGVSIQHSPRGRSCWSYAAFTHLVERRHSPGAWPVDPWEQESNGESAPGQAKEVSASSTPHGAGAAGATLLSPTWWSAGTVPVHGQWTPGSRKATENLLRAKQKRCQHPALPTGQELLELRCFHPLGGAQTSLPHTWSPSSLSCKQMKKPPRRSRALVERHSPGAWPVDPWEQESNGESAPGQAKEVSASSTPHGAGAAGATLLSPTWWSADELAAYLESVFPKLQADEEATEEIKSFGGEAQSRCMASGPLGAGKQRRICSGPSKRGVSIQHSPRGRSCWSYAAFTHLVERRHSPGAWPVDPWEQESNGESAPGQAKEVSASSTPHGAGAAGATLLSPTWWSAGTVPVHGQWTPGSRKATENLLRAKQKRCQHPALPTGQELLELRCFHPLGGAQAQSRCMASGPLGAGKQRRICSGPSKRGVSIQHSPRGRSCWSYAAFTHLVERSCVSSPRSWSWSPKYLCSSKLEIRSCESWRLFCHIAWRLLRRVMPQQRCMEKSGSSERQKQTERCMVSLHVCRHRQPLKPEEKRSRPLTPLGKNH
ncbi:uncharacterized protein LOC129215757 isoform X12 [Grus americana]|uniref:uncharacterized protein LOC129215757 isoform X12 n=1 Tax=Grus americana TaxID=9117 RepID=UPI00240816A3|nr:uncharacterized protein LOC129215757 isoform X12 [Grus americana]